ncbi:hypothetical protein O3G_MSEX015291 [Manduca sexta]|uniref:C2H2-type domain-containing protein n=1 Tax=Manduca sexta TaxID=7130 RepID=A0A921ZWW9_MANSE|nr:hypothetical protein O3G_MSEX015291 [Manduca sexta]KAG6465647.1 hypothetical protein O3G_MSEX015291 [Manduca sexta]
MSRISSKNSRKDKLVVRDGVNLDEAINVELQNIAQTSSKLDKMDENDEDDQLVIDIANIKKEINESSYVENPNMKFTVRVEVEEYNEDVKHKIKIEMHDISPVEPQTLNQRVILKDGNIHNSKKPKQPFKSVVVDLNELYDEVDRIVRTSNNIADEILARELKNNWGSVLRLPIENDPINIRLQEVIHKWKIWTSASKYRDVPLFYKCYICQTAWWRLDPFRTHLKIHHIDSFRIDLEEHSHESNIIAYGTINIPPVKYLKVEGDCWKCNKPFEHHISAKKQNASYSCKCCDDRFYSCMSLKAHEGVCWQYLKHIEVERDQEMAMCRLCQCMFATETELETHMISNHSVRSDLPIQSQYKTCSSCNYRYFIHALHCCNKKQMSYNCDKCYKGFSTKLTLAIHTLLTEKDVHCKICTETLDNQCMEIVHYQNHSNMFKVAYKCCMCSNMEVFLDASSFRKHRLVEHRQKNDKRRYNFEKVLLPITYFPEEENVAEKREAVRMVVGQKDYADYPVFEARDVRKTYQAKPKVYPEEELKEALTVIKQEMADDEEHSQDSCGVMVQRVKSEDTSYDQMSEVRPLNSCYICI